MARLMIQSLKDGLCTHNYAKLFNWNPCHKAAVALIWWDNEIIRLGPYHRYICGEQVCFEHLVATLADLEALSDGA